MINMEYSIGNLTTQNVWEAVKPVLLNRWTWAVASAAAAYQLYRASVGKCTSKRRLDGLTALVTGANTGIGLETARDLARRGARVLLACRDPQRGLQALEEVRAAATQGSTVELLSLDLASLASVRECAAKVNDTEPRLDILINNAGAGGLGPGLTPDGLHRGLQVNHFGPFMFTLLLVDLMKKSAPSRIIFVSSRAHLRASRLLPGHLDHRRARDFSDFKIYPMSKLLNVLNSNELARRLQGTGVTVNSLHPGLVLTDFFRFLSWWKMALMAPLLLLSKNTVEGAQTTIHVAVAEELEGVTGRFFSDCKESRMARQACDKELAEEVWTKSAGLLGVRDHERPSAFAWS